METTRRGLPRKTPAQWAEVLAEYRGSKLTQAAFARSCGVSVAALHNHLYRRSGGDRCVGLVQSRGFVPVRVRGEGLQGDGAATAKPTLVVRWSQGTCLELHVGPSAAGVAELIRALIEPCSP